MHALPDLFVSIGVVVRPVIVAVLLFGLWVGLQRAGSDNRARIVAWLGIAVPLLAWFALTAQLGQAGVFKPRPDASAPTIPLAIIIPLAVGLVLLTRSKTIAAVADVIPPSWLIGVQVYRVFGAVFLAHWAAGNLPGEFALPAGLGDVMVGLLALPVAFLVRSRARRGRAAAYAWNLLGIIDLVNAVTLGFLSAPGRFQMLALDHPNTLVGTYPLVMIPAFAVPLSLILHGLSLWQLRRSARTGGAMPEWNSVGAAVVPSRIRGERS